MGTDPRTLADRVRSIADQIEPTNLMTAIRLRTIADGVQDLEALSRRQAVTLDYIAGDAAEEALAAETAARRGSVVSFRGVNK